MSSWAGFTDDDLKKLVKSEKSLNEERKDPKQGNFRRSAIKKQQRPPGSFERISEEERLVTTKETGHKMISNESVKHITKPIESITEVSGTIKNDVKQISTGTGVQVVQKIEIQVCENKAEETKQIMEKEDKQFLMDDSSILEKEMENLKKFREQQKLMEEMNKKKKAMLTNAILQKEKHTRAEAKKLQKLKEELAELDQLVVSDISIIRDKIEDASRNYLTAQKRYELAEKEFIEAKIESHKKLELKEQLTEHLYAVIHQNEQRKASKLQDLMTKLEMEESDSGEDKINDNSGNGENHHFIANPPPLLVVNQPNVQNFRQKVFASDHQNCSENDGAIVESSVLNNKNEMGVEAVNKDETVESRSSLVIKPAVGIPEESNNNVAMSVSDNS